jgi:hypothetical protein
LRFGDYVFVQVQEQERYIEVPVERISYKDVEVVVEQERLTTKNQFFLVSLKRSHFYFPVSQVCSSACSSGAAGGGREGSSFRSREGG